MNKEFQQFFHGEWSIDPTYEFYVDAWVAYHVAADKVDGHLPLSDRSLCSQAVSAGFNAMDKVLYNAGLNRPQNSDQRWQDAKMEALRRIESGFYDRA